jgi:hypothetical protein
MKHFAGYRILLILLSAKLLLHLYINGQWSFHRDELLYLALGNRLDWGYASVPPAIGFWAWFGEHILGGSVEAIRLISTVFGTATVALTGMMAHEMMPASRQKAQFHFWIIGLSGLTCGAFLRTSMLFMPVVFDMFYWTLISYLLLKYINTAQYKWLYWLGLACALGLLNKYTIFIQLFALLPGLFFSPLRKLFVNKHLYIAAGIALIVFAPNIWWQIDHKLPLFRHFGELAETQFAHVTLSGFVSDQLQFFLPALPVWLAGGYYLLSKAGNPSWRVFGLMYITTLAVLLLFSAKSYYSLGAYPVLLAAGAAFLTMLTETRARWVRVALLLWMLGFWALTIPAALPLFPPEKEAVVVKQLAQLPGLDGILRWEDGQLHDLPQDFADMTGWEELGRQMGEIWQAWPDKSTAYIYAESYGQAGAIEHFGRPYQVPEVWSFSDNYQYWLPDTPPNGLQTLFYVNDELGDDMPGFFLKIEKIWELDMPLSRQHGVQIYRCSSPTPAFFNKLEKAFLAAKSHKSIED